MDEVNERETESWDSTLSAHGEMGDEKSKREAERSESRQVDCRCWGGESLTEIESG